MRQVFVTSDLHLGHEKAALARGFSTVENHDEALIERWNKVVKPTDVVWNLGDVVFCPATKLHLVARLNGLQHLVIGNHEHHNLARYAPYFNKMVVALPYKEKWLFTHIPVHESQLEARFHMTNVHGHIHSTQPELFITDPRYFNVNCEFHGYAPIHVDSLDQMIKERQC